MRCSTPFPPVCRHFPSGAFSAPPRQSVAAERGSVLTMAGRRADSPVVVKLVGVFPGNVAMGLEPHPAMVASSTPRPAPAWP